MPNYEYICDKCEISFEESFPTFEQAREKREKVKCPQCNKIAKRTISSVPAIYKAFGFYSMDKQWNRENTIKNAAKDGEVPHGI